MLLPLLLLLLPHHDRGILIVDHVTLDELLSVDEKPIMAEIENRDGLHARRMQQAYSREVTESSLLPKGQKMSRMKYLLSAIAPVKKNGGVSSNNEGP
ncbi:hypothetical protein ACHAXA_006323 [Cyclostephanos tholiformis]|uniref:Uncharacterized protein n=1 Tax=Cyclostephanos tholiformis TaxID=382380 RepID=A0ABD3R5N1_9STRA